MNKGFDGDNKIKVNISQDEVTKLLKKYKKIKKYMKSPLFEIKKIDGNEKVVSELLEEYYKDPIE
jgi:hypothetical protein